jgi:hypothetical protein
MKNAGLIDNKFLKSLKDKFPDKTVFISTVISSSVLFRDFRSLYSDINENDSEPTEDSWRYFYQAIGFEPIPEDEDMKSILKEMKRFMETKNTKDLVEGCFNKEQQIIKGYQVTLKNLSKYFAPLCQADKAPEHLLFYLVKHGIIKWDMKEDDLGGFLPKDHPVRALHFIRKNSILFGLDIEHRDFEEAIFRMNQLAQLSSKYPKLLESDRTAIEEYLKAFSQGKVPLFPALKADELGWITKSQLAMNKNKTDHWNIIDTLHRHITKCVEAHRGEDRISYMGPYLALVQSSGHGKTSTLIKLGEREVLAYTSLGTGECFPPGNTTMQEIFSNVQTQEDMTRTVCELYIFCIAKFLETTGNTRQERLLNFMKKQNITRTEDGPSFFADFSDVVSAVKRDITAELQATRVNYQADVNADSVEIVILKELLSQGTFRISL